MLFSPQRVIKDTNKKISEVLSGDLKILRQVNAYVVASGGKRIRPLFTYYVGKAHRLDDKQLITLGALLEIVHAASLLHDDVVDGADERRSQPTASKLYGNKQVVLAGDHVLASGLRHLNSLGNAHFTTIFTEAVQALSSAELLQMQHHFDLKTPEKVHQRVIDGKTAVLFRAAGALVGVLNGEQDFYRARTAELGLTFGRFFQLRDDYLDYFDAARLKKKGLQDFTNGIVTRPLRHLMAAAGKAERAVIQAEWEKARKLGQPGDTGKILGLMDKHRVAERCTAELGELERIILQGLDQLPERGPRELIRGEFQKILAVRAG